MGQAEDSPLPFGKVGKFERGSEWVMVGGKKPKPPSIFLGLVSCGEAA